MTRWGMVIDTDRCTGCGACVVACHAENNIQTVGEVEAVKGRAMHWMRIERYYDGDFPDIKVRFLPVLVSSADGTLRAGLPRIRDLPQSGRPERDGLRAVHRDAVLREQLSLHGSLLQLVRGRVAGAAGQAAKPGRRGASGGRHGEVHLLRAAHPGPWSGPRRRRTGR